jgi:hypothetical protein
MPVFQRPADEKKKFTVVNLQQTTGKRQLTQIHQQSNTNSMASFSFNKTTSMA